VSDRGSRVCGSESMRERGSEDGGGGKEGEKGRWGAERESYSVLNSLFTKYIPLSRQLKHASKLKCYIS